MIRLKMNHMMMKMNSKIPPTYKVKSFRKRAFFNLAPPKLIRILTTWYKDNGGSCSHGSLCGDGGYWKLSNVQVTAESQI